MKKIVTLLAFALICSGAYAQFNKGRILAGGSVAFSALTGKTKDNNSTSTNSHTTSFNISPDVGYFIIDNVAVGGMLNLSTWSRKGDGDDDSKQSQTEFTLTPFGRYYLDQGIFFQGQVGFGSRTDKYKLDNSNTTVSTKYGVLNWAIGAGYAYFLNDNVAVEPIVGFTSSSYKNKDADVKSIESGIFLRIALQVYLGARN